MFTPTSLKFIREPSPSSSEALQYQGFMYSNPRANKKAVQRSGSQKSIHPVYPGYKKSKI
jgi:hypothetical protein